MLSEFRSTDITWDKATSRIYSPVTANESDENGRKLVVQVVNGGQVEDLTGASLHLYWETIDKLHDGLDVFKAVDLKKGEFELSYTTGMLSNKGVLNANLVLVDTVGRVVSERFKITVTEGIDNDAIQSENSFSSLTKALIEVGPRLNLLTEKLEQKVNRGQGEITQSDLSQEVKEQMTGGSVAVVGDNSVLTQNIVDKQVTPIKTTYMNAKTVALTPVDGKYINNTGVINEIAGFSYSQEVILKKHETIVLVAEGYQKSVTMISKWVSGGVSGVPLVVSVDDTKRTYTYTAISDNEIVRLSWRNRVTPVVYTYINLFKKASHLENEINQLDTEIKKINSFEQPNLTAGIYINAVPAYVPHTIQSYVYTDLITLIKGDVIEIINTKNTQNVSIVTKCDTNGELLAPLLTSSSNAPTNFAYEPTADVEYIRLSYHNTEDTLVKLSRNFNNLVELLYKPKSETEENEKDLDYLKFLISDVTVVGDSLMDGGYYGPGYSGEAIKESPPYFLEKLTDWTITDVSRNGATPVSWWNTFGATTNYAKSDAVIIGLGTNAGMTDTMTTDVNVGTQTFANTQTGQYARIINAFRKANPKAHIFLVKVFASSGDVAITNTVIDKMATLFDCKLLDESELFGNPIMHYKNTVHYGKVGNLHKAKILLNQILEHVNNDLVSYEVLIDTY